MGSDPWEELADLTSSLRAHIQDAASRGLQRFPLQGPLPDPVAVEPPAKEAPAPAKPAAPSPWSQIAKGARTELKGAPALKQVREELGDCRRCPLHSARRGLVFGAGNPDADLVIIGNAPQYHEDQSGVPFSGPEGEMLDKMLNHVLGLTREHVYLLNIVKCRPLKQRLPVPEEVRRCRPFLHGQIRALEPKVMLTMGEVAFQGLNLTDRKLDAHRGTWRKVGGIWTLATYHPTRLLREPALKRQVFEDLKTMRARYDEIGGRR